jgi:hypothetical protein
MACVKRFDAAAFGKLLDDRGLYNLPAVELTLIEHHDRERARLQGVAFSPPPGTSEKTNFMVKYGTRRGEALGSAVDIPALDSI